MLSARQREELLATIDLFDRAARVQMCHGVYMSVTEWFYMIVIRHGEESFNRLFDIYSTVYPDAFSCPA